MVVRRVNKEVGQHSVRRAQSEDIQRPDVRKREIGIKPPRHFLLLPSIWQRSRLKIKHGARLPCSFSHWRKQSQLVYLGKNVILYSSLLYNNKTSLGRMSIFSESGEFVRRRIETKNIAARADFLKYRFSPVSVSAACQKVVSTSLMITK